MLVYMAFLAVVVLIGIPMCRNRVGKAVYCSVAGAVLFVLAATRKYTGYDYNLYAQVYVNYLSMTTEEIGEDRFEKGIAMPMKLLGDVLYRDYQWIFVIYAFFFALALMLILYKTSDKPYLGVFFYITFGMYFISLNFMRQMFASFIVVLGMRYIKTGQFFRYLIVVLFASCFHLSAIVMIPFYFILRIKANWISLAAFVGVGALIFIFSWDIIRILAQFIPKYGSTYLAESQADSGEMSGSRFGIYTVFYGLCFLLVFLFRKRMQEKDPFNKIWINCMFFAFYFDLFSMKHNILGRLAIPFLIAASAIALPKAFECLLEWCRDKFGSDRKKLTIASTVSIATVCIMCVGIYGYMIGHNFNGVNPYQNIFDDTEWVNPRERWEKFEP